MDPLGASITLLEVAAKVKETIEKVGQNRARLRQLAADVESGIADIHRFCGAHRMAQDVSGARELHDALNSVSRELHYVLRRCEKISAQHGRTRFSKVRANVSAWLNRDEIENDIIRLKEQVQTCHLRFISFSSARTEHNVLLLLYEHRARARQIDGLVPGLLLSDEASNLPQLMSINMAEPGDVMYQYLRQQLTNFLPMVSEFVSTRTHWYEIPDEWHSTDFSLSSSIYEDPRSPSTHFRDALLELLQTSRTLSDGTPTTVQYVASALFRLAGSLDELGQLSDALSAMTKAAELYGRLVEDNSAFEFSCHLGHSLKIMSTMTDDLDDEDTSLQLSEESIAVWTQILGTTGMERYSGDIAAAMLLHSYSLSCVGRAAQALEYCEMATNMARQLPNSSDGGLMVRWDWQGNAPVAFASGTAGYRSVDAAVIESFALFTLAMIRGELASYAEAWATGMQAIKCFETILDTYPESRWLMDCSSIVTNLREEAVAWVPMIRSPSQHPLVIAELGGRRRIVEQVGSPSLPPATTISPRYPLLRL
ncbi:hypothetical protein HGRIS_011688 [Hohenbuehelia grisea]|uniref:Fungal N-terminal domain-containing protein n=1 Tax=Hohenbuehelia grisea TaxID=104357 RepID=A0ABR3JXY5_9AGAR